VIKAPLLQACARAQSRYVLRHRCSGAENQSEVAMTALYAALDKGRPYILSLLRIVAALLFLEHGLQKFLGFPSAGPALTPLLYVQGVIEIVGGLLLLIGLYSRLVAFILAGDMAVAYFMAHFPRSFFPAVNAGDASVLYCFVFFYIVFAGSGPLSVDRLLKQD
jgi:putative oxidoreductase